VLLEPLQPILALENLPKTNRYAFIDTYTYNNIDAHVYMCTNAHTYTQLKIKLNNGNIIPYSQLPRTQQSALLFLPQSKDPAQ